MNNSDQTTIPTLKIIESRDAEEFAKQVNHFTSSHLVDKVEANNTSFTLNITKYVAMIWHFGPKSVAT